MRSRGLDRGRSDLSFTEETRTGGSVSVELSVSELDKSQGDQNVKYNDYNDSRQKLYKYEQEIERLRQENDRWGK